MGKFRHFVMELSSQVWHDNGGVLSFPIFIGQCDISVPFNPESANLNISKKHAEILFVFLEKIRLDILCELSTMF